MKAAICAEIGRLTIKGSSVGAGTGRVLSVLFLPTEDVPAAALTA
jgi:hypothetical protein